MSQKPVLVLVPGMASVGKTVYAPLISELKRSGWEDKDLVAINLPSVDTIANKSSIAPTALDADIGAIRDSLHNFIERDGRDVIIVGHSYGGTPSLYASEGLWKHQRATAGKTGGVVRAALISSSLSLPGEVIAAVRGQWLAANQLPGDGGARVEMIDGEAFLIPDGFEHVWMNDIESPAVDTLLKPAAMSSVLSPTATHLEPKDWKISYLVLKELDLGMPEQFQRYLVQRAREAGAEVEVAELKSGHFAQISHAREVADWLLALE